MAKTTKKFDKKFYERVCTEIDRIFDLYGKPTASLPSHEHNSFMNRSSFLSYLSFGVFFMLKI